MESLVEREGLRSVLEPPEKAGVLLRAHGGYPHQVVLAVADVRFGKRGLQRRGDAFRDTHGNLDGSRGASETPGGVVGEAAPVGTGVIGPMALLFAKRTKRCGLAVSATGRFSVSSLVMAFAMGKRLCLLQGGQAAEARREVGGFREGQAAGHPVYLLEGHSSGDRLDWLPVAVFMGVCSLTPIPVANRPASSAGR